MDVYIITGASKGIGFELLKQLQVKRKKVTGIARNSPEGAEKFVAVDLLETTELEKVLTGIIDEYIADASSFTLVNNAGTVDPIGLIGDVDAGEMTKSLTVNLTAPMILSNGFITRLKDFKGKKRIINISSGAGRNPYEGWGTYCTTKAGLDHFSRVVALEQKNAAYPVDIVAIAPGIIDTGMQETIRSSTEEAFPLLEQFIDYKEQGLLSSAEQTAEKLIAFMASDDLNTVGPIADLRNI